MPSLDEVLDEIQEMIQFRIGAISADRNIYAWDPDGVRHRYVVAQQTYADGQIDALQELDGWITKRRNPL